LNVKENSNAYYFYTMHNILLAENNQAAF